MRRGGPLDPGETQRAASDPATSVWVAASAGTGKTKVLTDRVLRLMLAGSPPGRILCLTFTKAAAAEMENRVQRRLARWATVPDGELEEELRELTGESPEPERRLAARRLFARVLDAPGGMKIMTIHAFCQSLLRRFPIEAGVAPHFEVMDERSADEALADAREAVLAAARRGADPGLATALGEVTRVAPEGTFDRLLRCLAVERARLGRALAGGRDVFQLRLAARLGLKPGAGLGETIAAACAEASFDGAGLRVAARQLLVSASVNDRKCGAALASWLADAAARAAGFEEYLSAFFTAKLERRAQLATKRFVAAFPACAAALETEATRLAAVIEQRNRVALFEATAALVRLGEAFLDAYRRHKALRGALDYDDLILGAVALLSRPGVAPWVLFKLDGGLDHILVDEAQDTNPEQWQVVAALAEEFFGGEGARAAGRTLFAVGDAKQSIYSFQRAEPLEFLSMRDRFRRRIAETEHVGRQRFGDVDLTVSFRSTSAVLAAVDATFARPAAADGVALDGKAIRHFPHRGRGGLVELWPLVEPVDPPVPQAWEPPLEQRHAKDPSVRLAETIADTVAGWIRRKSFLPSRERPIRAGDVMVLVRRRNAFVANFVRALKQRGVPIAGADRMVLAEQLAVEDLMALGDFLLLPEDDLTLATVLKGPLFGIDEDTLFRLAWKRAGSLWAALRRAAAADPALAGPAAELGALLGRADYAPPFELFADILGPRGGRRALLARLGPEAADPVDEFLAAALAYERQHVPSLQGFLHWLRAGEAEVKRDLEQRGRDELRILTVHGAKGLQAPIVILPDTCQMPPAPPPLFWTEDGLPLWCRRKELDPPAAAAARAAEQERREQEYRRLLYVAMTRAEDRLYVCGWRTRTNGGDRGWYELVRAALRDLPGVEKFDFGAGVPEAGWAGEGLRLRHLEERSQPEERAQEVPVADEVPTWLFRMPEPEPVPPRPLAPSQPARPDPPARSPLADEAGPAGGFRRGLLVHRLLQGLPELPPGARAAACRRFLARPAHGLAPAAQAALAAETLAVLERPDFAALFGPESKAEVPIVGLIGNRALAGQIDRLVVTGDEVLIVDYKTLRPPPASEEGIPDSYLHQLAVYVAAVGRIYPGKRVRAALLWTDGPRLMPVSPARLAPWSP